MRYFVICVFSMLLTACASEQIAIHKPVEVLVPTPVPCVKESDIPKCSSPELDATDLRGSDLYVQVQVILRDLEKERACNREFRVILNKCAEPIK